MHEKSFFPTIVQDKYGNEIRPITDGQNRLIQEIDRNQIVFVNGPAGTGKSFLSICKAVAGLDNKEYKRIIITRPIVESGESMGFLPGSIAEKTQPYMQHLFDYVAKLKEKKKQEVEHNPPVMKDSKGKRLRKKQVKELVKKPQAHNNRETDNEYDDRIQVCPLAFMRGATFDNCFIVLDEAQNVTKSQMKLFLTRIGTKSKVLILGDETQTDLGSNIASGFNHAQSILHGINGIGYVTLTEDDIVRSKIIKEIILAYRKSP